MHTSYCCASAKTTAYLRYGRQVTRVTHQNYYIDGVGYCEATGTSSEPDRSIVPTKYAKRFFVTQLGNLKKIYMCPECIKDKSPLHGFYKTGAEAIAAYTTVLLCEE